MRLAQLAACAEPFSTTISATPPVGKPGSLPVSSKAISEKSGWWPTTATGPCSSSSVARSRSAVRPGAIRSSARSSAPAACAICSAVWRARTSGLVRTRVGGVSCPTSCRATARASSRPRSESWRRSSGSPFSACACRTRKTSMAARIPGYCGAVTALRYVHVDVFTHRPLEGNQLAVFTDARELDDETMQALALEIGFSESVFVLPPERGGTVRIRIFTPRTELPFAGHPVLGAAWVLAAPLQRGVVELETGRGSRSSCSTRPSRWPRSSPTSGRSTGSASPSAASPARMLHGRRACSRPRLASSRTRRRAPPPVRSRSMPAGTASPSGAPGSRSRRAPRSGGLPRCSRSRRARTGRSSGSPAVGARSWSRAASSGSRHGEEICDRGRRSLGGAEGVAAGRSCRQIGGREGVSGACRLHRTGDLPSRYVRDLAVGDDVRALRAEREEHLRRTQPCERLGLRAADERLRLLVTELEDVHVAQHISDVAVGSERSQIGCAYESLRVNEQTPAVARERSKCLLREVGANERADVDPARVLDGVERLRRAPRFADGVLPHDPPLALVAEAVGGRRR